MIYYTKENEVLDYICWKIYFQNSMLSSLLEQEAEYYEPAIEITEMFDIGHLTGRTDDQLGKMVNKVLEANPGLTQYGVFLPSGLELEMPDIEDIDTAGNIVQLWD